MKLAEAAYVRYEHRHGKVASKDDALAWWHQFDDSADCVAFRKAPGDCTGDRIAGLTHQQEWNILKGVTETTVVCGATDIVASSAATPVVGMGAGELCWWISTIHFSLWGFG